MIASNGDCYATKKGLLFDDDELQRHETCWKPEIHM